MRNFTIAAMLFLTAPSVAAATSWASDENWRGPGWYLTITSPMASTIEKGPFATEEECTKAMPSEAVQKEVLDAIGFEYRCENLQ